MLCHEGRGLFGSHNGSGGKDCAKVKCNALTSNWIAPDWIPHGPMLGRKELLENSQHTVLSTKGETLIMLEDY